MKIYLLAGKAGSGKDLMGRYMKTQYDFAGHNACILHITTPSVSYTHLDVYKRQWWYYLSYVLFGKDKGLV